MDKKVYWRGRIATPWYNFTELIAYALTYRRMPDSLVYEKRIRYGEEKQQYYNTYCRKDLVGENKPLMIYVHGGGFVSGITDMRNAYIRNFAQRGFFTASLSYTYAPKKVFPEPLQELCTAIDCLFDRAKEQKFDTNDLLLCGESAGGYFIFMLTALATDPSLAEKLGIRFRHLSEFSVKAMVSHSGCFNLKKLLDKKSPQSKFPDIKMMTCSFLGKRYRDAVDYLNTPEGELSYAHVTAQFPPTFFATGAADKLRFESYDAMEAYKANDIPYEHFEGTGPYAAHAWTIAPVFKQGKECLNKTMRFVESYFFKSDEESNEEREKKNEQKETV